MARRFFSWIFLNVVVNPFHWLSNSPLPVKGSRNIEGQPNALARIPEFGHWRPVWTILGWQQVEWIPGLCYGPYCYCQKGELLETILKPQSIKYKGLNFVIYWYYDFSSS